MSLKYFFVFCTMNVFSFFSLTLDTVVPICILPSLSPLILLKMESSLLFFWCRYFSFIDGWFRPNCKCKGYNGNQPSRHSWSSTSLTWEAWSEDRISFARQATEEACFPGEQQDRFITFKFWKLHCHRKNHLFSDCLITFGSHLAFPKKMGYLLWFNVIKILRCKMFISNDQLSPDKEMICVWVLCFGFMMK